MPLIRVELSFCVVGLEVKDNRIITAPPIMRRWIGKRYSDFYLYYERKGKLVIAEQLKDVAEQASLF